MARGSLFTPFDQGRIYGLHEAGYSQREIAERLNTDKGTIGRVLKRLERDPRTPPRRGKPTVLSTSKHQRLVDRLTLDAFYRRLRIEQIAHLEGLDNHDIKTIRKALLKEGYSRHPAQRKPLLSERNKAERLYWAQEHVNWSDRQWERLLWTDEASIRCGYWGQVYVTRKQDEALNKDCLFARFRDYSAYMVWGSVSQSGPKEFFVFEKGGINQDVYIKNIVPLIQKAAIAIQEEGIFRQKALVVQDGAPSHTAKATQAEFLSKGLELIKWPAQSPDLNPIENIWSLLKYKTGLHFPTTRDKVVEAAQLEWSRLTASDISRCCQSMRQRCQAVIDAQGGPTRW